MACLSLQHSPAAARADFALYGVAAAALAAWAVHTAPAHTAWAAVGWGAAGLVAWSGIEYALHRFVLHGLQPFRRWHGLHHQQPTALIGLPTVASGALMLVLVFLPALGLVGLWQACAFTAGVLAGYLAYSGTHHATHHSRSRNGWLLQRKRWHALHHHHPAAGCYGVSSALWDHLLGSALRRRPGPIGERT